MSHVILRKVATSLLARLVLDVNDRRPSSALALARLAPWVLRVQFSRACAQSHWWPISAYTRRPSVIKHRL